MFGLAETCRRRVGLYGASEDAITCSGVQAAKPETPLWSVSYMIETRLSGIVDGFDPPRRIRGWVVDRALTVGTPDVNICIKVAGREIGLGRLSFERPDIVPRPGCLVGFAIECQEDVRDEEIVAQQVGVEVSCGCNSLTLPIWDLIIAQAQTRVFIKSVQQLSLTALADLVKAAASHGGLGKQVSADLQRAGQVIGSQARGTVKATKLQLKSDIAAHLSSVLVAVGTGSVDESAIIGFDGFLYLTDGTNAVLSRYSLETSDTIDARRSLDWISLFESRNARLMSAGVKYVQLIVPEKISVLPENFPYSLDTPTRTMRQIEICARERRLGSYISLLDALVADSSRQFSYYKTDSHPSPRGNWTFVAAVLARLGLDNHLTVSWRKAERFSGDLARRFFGVALYEEIDIPAIEWCGKPLEDPILEEIFEPDGGGHTGHRRVWRSPNAPFPDTAVAFGNSCFERGAHPGGLSWWFSRLFRKFHFIWSSDLDDVYVTQNRPDIVICQTVERFLFANVPRD